MNKHKFSLQNIFQFITIVLIIFLINYISSFVFFRVDLTSENRYRLKPVTKKILKNLNDIIYLEIYLEGDLPVEFERLQRAIKEELSEFKVYAEDNLEYEFINPSRKEGNAKEKLFNELKDKGLNPINLKHKDKEGTMSQKIIFPGAIMHYKGREMAVNLLNNNKNATPRENLNQSVETLEYKLALLMKNISSEKHEKIAFLEGHGELNQYQVDDITREMAKFYRIDRGTITHVNSLKDYKAVIIAKPQRKFSKKEKLAIDQYIMHGGKVLWFLDMVKISHDSLRSGSTVAMMNDLNITDQLFKYGVRINPVLVKDVHCNVIPVKTSLSGVGDEFTPVPWPYFPLLNPPEDHPITSNLDLIKTEYINTIDTIRHDSGIKKTILLTTSEYAREINFNTPAIVSLKEIEEDINRSMYNKSFLPVGVLMEGIFPSVFQNRPVNALFQNQEDIIFKPTSDTTRMLVIADGDLIKNEVRRTPQGAMISPLGYDRYTRQTFGNKSFIMNCLHYLTDEQDLMQLRAKKIKLRLLDRAQIEEQRLHWQLLNTLAPVLFVLLFGIFIYFLRKRKYAR